ncbi:centrosomal protein of 57 kDa isoform X1 [Tachysurus fulvidraco]|uniref:centrosomal protein of 57 kDa isoform X1 n=1 Tax=Tachysurus fulvidraco TaxID=1234273 RepID=UPI000F4F6E63|nr:centrosomal protein of 57 kDa isoform X1 [Tachysurus fulvidraco]XP_026994549.1 centrosomal protein of 57 kDa isoform X1 [Tachysurus fulvidraco]
MSQMLDCVSLASYTEYPTDRPFINTHTTHRPAKPVKAFPESSSAAILSALQNLQEKIHRLELERMREERNLKKLSGENPHKRNIPEREPHEDRDSHRPRKHEFASHLAAAEIKCARLEKQLDLMKRTVRSTESDRTAMLKHQECVRSSSDVCEKLERLEQDYRRLTHTQNNAEVKIRELECKLQEEEHHRKLIQDKAAQLQTGLEANRVLMESVWSRPHRSSKSTKKKLQSKKPLQQRHSHTQPHYRLSLGDVPFVAGTSTGTSHSVRANVQHVLHLLKQHNPQLCNERVLRANGKEASECQSCSSSSSLSSSSCSKELSELLQALQDEFAHFSFKHQELGKQVQACRSDRLRQDLEREMENLVKKMEEKGEQIAKVRRHQAQVEKLKKQSRQHEGELKFTSALKAKSKPGERSKDSLRLLKDMRTLQTSLSLDQHYWDY